MKAFFLGRLLKLTLPMSLTLLLVALSHQSFATIELNGARTRTTTGHGDGSRGPPVASAGASVAWRAAARRRLPRSDCESEIGARR